MNTWEGLQPRGAKGMRRYNAKDTKSRNVIVGDFIDQGVSWKDIREGAVVVHLSIERL